MDRAERETSVPDLVGGQPLSRRDLLARAGMLTGAMALAGPASALASPLRAPRRVARPAASTLTWALSQDPVYLIPMDATGLSIEATYYIYESLLGWDKNLNMVPSLATSWETPNPTTFIFKLREGVKFHSGKSFDAEDVKYSIEKAKKPPAPGVDNGFFPPIEKVTVINKHTVKITTSQPAQDVLGFFAWGRYCEMVPAGLYESTDVKTHTDGTGPFMLGEFVPSDHVTLVRNPHYWRKGVPAASQLVLKILADEGSRLDALRSGAIQGGSFSADSAKIAASDSSLVVYKLRSGSPNEVEFNLKDTSQPWNDVRVRQAVNHAIDRTDLINKALEGEGFYSGKILQGYGDWPIPEAELRANYEKHDVKKARALLKAAGHHDGFQVTLNSIAEPAVYTTVATVLKAQLANVGIDVTVQPQDIGTFSANDGAGKFEWESTGRGMRGDVSEFFSDFNPSGSTFAAWFKGGWNDPQLQRLLTRGLATSNHAKRRAIYRQAEAIALTQWPELPLVAAYSYIIVSKEVKGLQVFSLDVGWETGLNTARV
jgi:peptide/nickel transport system substrate-binding protein